MNNGKNLDREGASTSTPRRVEKVGEAQLIEDSAGRLETVVTILGISPNPLEFFHFIRHNCRLLFEGDGECRQRGFQ